MDYFEVKSSNTQQGHYYFLLKDFTGHILLTSTSYPSKKAVIEAVHNLQISAPIAAILDAEVNDHAHGLCRTDIYIR